MVMIITLCGYIVTEMLNCIVFVHSNSGNKYWSGLLSDYYGPRAAIYFKFLKESLENGYAFPLSNWRREWIKLTNDWQSSRKVYPVKSNGDAVDTSRWLYNKYLQVLESYDQ